ncbi:hypothetical protein A2957_01310 [Candidatus Roizmanbacteria bacterium RIFCSPLOWO2_01_FULL_38_11]|uniref:HAD family hydrolase n=1 Tax=Candidatus Roizmanbacteria bacterium RIFCSPLOWO2_01_FULL_38_11 TaxID=1802060 RepID=A0A1F7IL47_9BACT|nr:MAG: hypothetical protein A2957_01310 [Candidatus Roizmanbacteria bacterium RIFCSPLOWO2_01_FULL_38_11]
MIKTILFDLGEVILTNDWHYDCPEKFAAYSEYFSITYDQMEKGWNEAWPLYELGKITEDTFWGKFLTTAGSNTIDIQKAKTLWRKYFSSKPEMFPILARLKKNYSLVVLSSTGKEWLDYKIEKYHLNDYFSSYITTCNTSLRKTDEKIYNLVVKRLNIEPQEILFIDDNEKVIQMARQAGLKTILFENPVQLANELSKLHLFE